LKRTTKRSRTQSGAAGKQHDADEQDSIENSFSSDSSEEEVSIHGTDDEDDISGADSVDREAAAWEEGSDMEVDTGNDKAPSSFSRTLFSNALVREENAEQEVESPPSHTAGTTTLQLRDNDAASRTAAGGTRPPSHTTMEASLSMQILVATMVAGWKP
jgi:hypothetical protein